MSASESKPVDSAKGRWPWRLTITVLVLIAFAPTIIGMTPLRNWLINAALGDSFHASTRSASIGYLTPLSIEGFQLQATDGSMKVNVEAMNADKSWLKILLSGDDLGTFRFRDPVINLVTGLAEVTEEEAPEEPQPAAAKTGEKSLPSLTAEISGAGVRVRDASQQDPTVDLQDLNFMIRVEQRDYGSVIIMDPTTILDNKPLTPQLCSQGLQLIAPMLADVVDVDGRLSFRIDEFVAPVGGVEQTGASADISGKIRLSDLAVSPNNRVMGGLLPVLQKLGAADRDLTLTVTRDMEVEFRVADQRVYHEGLAFLLPIADNSFEIKTSGSVGFDETLDLRLSVTLPQQLGGDGLVGKLLASGPLSFRVTGTVNEPEFKLESTDQVAGPLEGLLRDVISPEKTADGQAAEGDRPAGTVLGIVEGILNEVAEPRDGERRPLLPRRQGEDGERQPLLPRRQAEPGERRPLLPRLRGRREQREEQPQESTEEEAPTPTPI